MTGAGAHADDFDLLLGGSVELADMELEQRC